MLAVIADSLQAIQARILLLDREIAIRAKADSVAKRLMTIPGIGPVVATALVALAPAASTSGEDVTSPRGWSLRPGNTPAGARNGWAGQPRWASAACESC